MKWPRVLRCLVLVTVTVSWLLACGGTSSRGHSGGSGGSGAATGSADGGGGGVGVATGGAKTGGNGDSGSDPNGGGMGAAAAATGGKASGPLPGTGGAPSIQRCKVQGDCPVTGEACENCEDGTVRCNSGYCDELTGTCKRLADICPAKCAADSDCPALNLACTVCKDGTQACPTSECVGGRCETTYPGCNGYDPCKDRNCGYYCTACGPEEDCGVGTLSFCNDRGKCQAGVARCGTGNCETAKDCGAPPAECVACTNDTCAARDCVDNKCVLACPPDTKRKCKDAYECPIPTNPCAKCPNGECATPACVQNTCELVCPL